MKYEKLAGLREHKQSYKNNILICLNYDNSPKRKKLTEVLCFFSVKGVMTKSSTVESRWSARVPHKCAKLRIYIRTAGERVVHGSRGPVQLPPWRLNKSKM